MQHLAQLLGIAPNHGRGKIQFGLHPGQRVVAGVKLQHVMDQGIQIHGLQVGSRQAGIVAKFIDQPLQGIDLVNDGFDGFGQQRLFGCVDLAGELHL